MDVFIGLLLIAWALFSLINIAMHGTFHVASDIGFAYRFTNGDMIRVNSILVLSGSLEYHLCLTVPFLDISQARKKIEAEAEKLLQKAGNHWAYQFHSAHEASQPGAYASYEKAALETLKCSPDFTVLRIHVAEILGVPKPLAEPEPARPKPAPPPDEFLKADLNQMFTSIKAVNEWLTVHEEWMSANPEDAQHIRDKVNTMKNHLKDDNGFGYRPSRDWRD